MRRKTSCTRSGTSLEREARNREARKRRKRAPCCFSMSATSVRLSCCAKTPPRKIALPIVKERYSRKFEYLNLQTILDSFRIKHLQAFHWRPNARVPPCACSRWDALREAMPRKPRPTRQRLVGCCGLPLRARIRSICPYRHPWRGNRASDRPATPSVAWRDPACESVVRKQAAPPSPAKHAGRSLTREAMPRKPRPTRQRLVGCCGLPLRARLATPARRSTPGVR